MTAAGTLRGWIDEPAGSGSVARGMVRVSGWAFDDSSLLDGAFLVVDEGPGVRVRLGVWREDVLAAYPSVPHAGASGFEGTVDLRASAREVVRIALLVHTPGGPWREAATVEVRTAAPVRERGGARARAAFTIVHDEALMLPLWLRYYGRYFDPDDLYVLDHASTDGSTVDLHRNCRVVAVHHEASFDHQWLKSTVETFQEFLLGSYDTVLFAEVDELVVADPRKYSGLDSYVDLLPPSSAARCVGFDVVHQPEEAPLRFDAPVLAQRRYWKASLLYNKRLLSRIPLRWSDGFHQEYRAPDDPADPDLLLVHLHRVDYDACLSRHRAAAAREWNELDIVRGDGAHNRIVEDNEFESWFRGDSDAAGPAELIPEHIRSVF
jgi:hypothetical protein